MSDCDSRHTAHSMGWCGSIPCPPCTMLSTRQLAASSLHSLHCAVCLVLVLSFPSWSCSQPGFLRHGNATSINLGSSHSAHFILSLSHLTSITLILSSASVITAQVVLKGVNGTLAWPFPSLFSSSKSSISSSQSYLFLPVCYRKRLSDEPSIRTICSQSDQEGSGLCLVNVTLYSGLDLASITYAVYNMEVVIPNRHYSSALVAGMWRYYAYCVPLEEAPLKVTLTTNWLQDNSSLFVSSEKDPLDPFFPATKTTQKVAAKSISTMLSGSALYIVGVLGPRSSPSPPPLSYTLSTVSTFPSSSAPIRAQNQTSESSSTLCWSDLLTLGLVAAIFFCPLFVIALAVFRAYYVRNRVRRTELPSVVNAEVRPAEEVRSNGEGGEGASEKEIEQLPVSTYERKEGTHARHGEWGHDELEDRCSICLDEFVHGVSVLKTMRCGHGYHSQCIGQWLRQKKNCPLCLQQFDRARNVRRQSRLQQEMELTEIERTKHDGEEDDKRGGAA